MKTLSISEIIGGTIFFIGIFIAVCTVDNSENEMLMRCVGVALAVIGSIITKFEPSKSDDDTEAESGYSKTDDHNPYPEE